MKKLISILLQCALLFSVGTASFSVNAEKDVNAADTGSKYVGKKISFTTDGPNFIARNESAEISGLKDGEHSISYLVYNNGGADISVNMFLQKGEENYNENNGTTVKIPAFSEKKVTYNFTVENGLIKGSLLSSKQEEAVLAFDIKLASENGLNLIPVGTEIIFKYNKTDGTDCLRTLNVQLASTKVSEVTTLSDADKDTPTGVVYTAKKDSSSPWFITKQEGGLFTKDDIKDGKLVFSQYMYNENDFDLHFTPALQTFTKSNSWDGRNGKAMTVEKNSGAWIEVSIKVNDDNTITVGNENYPIEKFFLRLNFSCEIPNGTKFVITTDAQKVTNMSKPMSLAGVTGKVTYSSAYANPPAPDKVAVDPNFHISSAFGNHMVLQRDMKVPVWGFSTYIGETVTVTFKGQTKTTTIPEDGKWTVVFDSMSADKTPAEMTATCNGKTHTYTDILVGDVFLIGGQSNADMSLSACGNQYSTEYKEQLIASGEGNIRFFRQGATDALADRITMNSPQYEPINGNIWTRETVSTANTFCASGFFFLHNIYNVIDVPVGMVMVASAGSPLSQLMSKEASDATGYDRFENNIPVSGMYNALMNPFVKMSFKAMLFDQGASEHNLAITDYGKYNEYLNAYVEDLREKNGNNFPFYYAQLTTMPEKLLVGRGEQRAVQFDSLKVVENSGMIVTMDQSAKPSDPDYSHPKYKEPVGQRFARLVLAKLYGVVDENYNISPMPEYAVRTEDGIVITYKYVGDGLKKLGGNEKLLGFEAITGVMAYTPVNATIISENQVLLDTTGIEGILGVQYGVNVNSGYIEFPDDDPSRIANLGNSENLPSPAFKLKVYASLDEVPKEPTPTPEAPADNTNTEKSNKPAIAIGIGAGVAIIGASAAATVVALKKRKKSR